MDENKLPYEDEQLDAQKTNVLDDDNEFIFLGFAEKISGTNTADNILPHINILGLSPFLGAFFLPLQINARTAVFAMRLRSQKETRIELRYSNNVLNTTSVNIDEVSKEEVALSVEESILLPSNFAPKEKILLEKDDNYPDFRAPGGWHVMAMNLAGPNNLFLPFYGEYELYHVISDNKWRKIGEFKVVEVNAAPLSDERKAALLADPRAVKSVRAKIQCSRCGSWIGALSSLIEPKPASDTGFHYTENLPDKFICSCKLVQIDLTGVKSNLHALFYSAGHTNGDFAFEKAYGVSSLNSIHAEFTKIINLNPKEETLQKFIEKNTILLHQFSPQLIKFKAPILNLHVTDFVILDAAGELIFIEIERVDTPLVKSGGHIHSRTNHAIEQVRQWMQEFSENRQAILRDWDIDPRQVTAVKGVVICGRNSTRESDKIRRLKARSSDIKIVTYDDLAAGLDYLLRTVVGL